MYKSGAMIIARGISRANNTFISQLTITLAWLALLYNVLMMMVETVIILLLEITPLQAQVRLQLR